MVHRRPTLRSVSHHRLELIDPPPRVDKCMHLDMLLEVLSLIEDWCNEATSWLAVFGGQPMEIGGFVGALVKTIRRTTKPEIMRVPDCGP